MKKKKSKTNKFKSKLLQYKKDDCNTFSLFEVLIIILISILFGIIIGYIITCSKNPLYSNDKNLIEIANVYSNLTTEYYDKVDKNKLSDGAIKGMIESVEDPFTNYMEAEIAKEFNETVKGSFVGVGITVMYEDGYYRIINIMDDTPASKSDLKVDDLLIKVNDKDLKDNSEVFKSISKGKVNSKVKLTIKRNDEEKDIVLKRAEIEIQSVHNRVFDYEGLTIGYVKIDTFSDNSYKQFKKAIERFTKRKVDRVIIDVRDNPGGQLEQTREILSIFFSKKTVLYQIQAKEKTKKVYSMNNSTQKYPVAVLINEGSASAAEILASCFKENYKDAVIVGTNSYGKGTIQKAQSLNSGNSIKYTTDKWLTAKGKWLDKKGVKPTIVIEQSTEYYENSNYENDSQLQEALRQLKESN